MEAISQPDLERLMKAVRQPVVVDGPNQYDPDELAGREFHYYGVGRGRCVSPN